jgi:hypothetical protein
MNWMPPRVRNDIVRYIPQYREVLLACGCVITERRNYDLQFWHYCVPLYKINVIEDHDVD